MQFILERLAARPITSSGQPDAFDLEAAVSAQIQRIVSARPVGKLSGEMTLLEFGMPNIVELAQDSKAQLEKYAARLLKLIKHYEPRLLQPSIALEDTSGKLTPYRLVISGVLMPDQESHPFRFELSDY